METIRYKGHLRQVDTSSFLITSVDNARVKAARALQRPRERRETGLCLLEGLHLAQTAFDAGAHFEDVFVSPRFVATANGAHLVHEIEAAGMTVTRAKDHVLQRLSSTQTPQGIVAVAHMQQANIDAFGGYTALLVADRIADPGNMGTMVRSAAAVGAALWIGAESTDVYDSKALRATVGTLFFTPHAQRLTPEQIIQGAADLGCRLVVADARGTTGYDQFDWREPYALVVGNEAQGVNERFLQKADAVVSLPLQIGVESLNAAVTASVCLFEAWRQRGFGLV